MEKLTTRQIINLLLLLNAVLLIVVLLLSFRLMGRPRFEKTKSLWIMFDTKTAQLCNASNPDGLSIAEQSQPIPQKSVGADQNPFDQFARPKWDGEGLSYCKDLK